MRALIQEVILSVDRDKSAATLTLRWKGGALTDLDVPLPRSRSATVRTEEATLDLVRRLAVFYPDTGSPAFSIDRDERPPAAIASRPTGSQACGPIGASHASNPNRRSPKARS